MNLEQELLAIVAEIPVIKTDRNYWFVRTEGGTYYDDFLVGGYIAIAYEKISLSNIRIAKDGTKATLNQLTDIVRSKYKNETKPSYVAGQLVRFAYLIKKGDIVIIPSEGSRQLYLGEVEANFAKEVEKPEDKCPFLKRKKVRWLQPVSKYTMDPKLYKMIFTHVTISDANEYATNIDRILNSIFIKNDKAHLILQVKTKNKIATQDFYGFGNIFDLTNDFLSANDVVNEDDFVIKTNVQSEGLLEIIQASAIPLGLLGIGLILNALTGGKLKFGAKYRKDQGIDIYGESEIPVGLIEQFRKFLSSRNNDKIKAKIVDKALENMKIKSPEDLNKLLDNNDSENT